MARLKKQVEHLKGIKHNTTLSHFDILSSHRFLRYWISAYRLSHIIVKNRDVEKYVLILGPLWDFLKEHDLKINDHQERKDLITSHVDSRNDF